MRPDVASAGLVWDALTFARNVGIAVDGASLARYLEGGPVAWATERQVELIGEALVKLRQRRPDLVDRIPRSRDIIGMRNVLVHGYLVVDGRIVWEAATREVPALIPVLETILAELDAQLPGSGA